MSEGFTPSEAMHAGGFGYNPADVMPADPLRELELPEASRVNADGLGWTPSRADLTSMMALTDLELERSSTGHVDALQANQLLTCAARLETGTTHMTESVARRTMAAYVASVRGEMTQ